jgi:hypothetical protein
MPTQGGERLQIILVIYFKGRVIFSITMPRLAVIGYTFRGGRRTKI